MKWKTMFEKEPLQIECYCKKAIIYVEPETNTRWQICQNCFRREKVKK